MEGWETKGEEVLVRSGLGDYKGDYRRVGVGGEEGRCVEGQGVGC